MVGKVGEISGLTGEIATSAKDQALGLHEVNAAIAQMDQVTQQNAAMVEESTAACFALAAEARQLSAMISAHSDNQPESAASAQLQGLEKARALRQAATGGGRASEAGWEEF
jgi:methyl-accepting chemotaxis protein